MTEAYLRVAWVHLVRLEHISFIVINSNVSFSPLAKPCRSFVSILLFRPTHPFSHTAALKCLVAWIQTRQDSDGKLKVTLVGSKSGEVVAEDTYDTVFFATGRRADTSKVGLEAAGVKVRESFRCGAGKTRKNFSNPHSLFVVSLFFKVGTFRRW